VLLFSAVLQQGMTAMCAQTPGCPVTALHHPDDRKENLAAQVSAIETSSLTCVTVKCILDAGLKKIVQNDPV